MSLMLEDISLELTDGIRAALGATLTVNAVNYPVYVTIPKGGPGDNYIYIGGVTETNDDTKDDFIYKGTVQIRITTDNLHQAEKKLARQILKGVRNTLKPTKASVFALDTLELISFSHESLSELVTQTDTDLIRIDLIDIYSFIIN